MAENWYHITFARNVPSILEKGLIPGHSVGIPCGLKYDNEVAIYGKPANYLARADSDLPYFWHWLTRDMPVEILTVDIQGLPRFADYFSLDSISYSPDMVDFLRWYGARGHAPIRVQKQIIEVTRSCAVPMVIPPERIRV